MTKTEQSDEQEKGCPWSDFNKCCEQMKTMMATSCGTEKGGFDCSTMMQQMMARQDAEKKHNDRGSEADRKSER